MMGYCVIRLMGYCEIELMGYCVIELRLNHRVSKYPYSVIECSVCTPCIQNFQIITAQLSLHI